MAPGALVRRPTCATLPAREADELQPALKGNAFRAPPGKFFASRAVGFHSCSLIGPSSLESRAACVRR